MIFLFQVLPVLHNPSHEQIGIFSPRVLNSGQKYFLYIEFEAELGEGLYGFYRSIYRTSTGETRSEPTCSQSSSDTGSLRFPSRTALTDMRVGFFLQNLGLHPLRAHKCSDGVPLF